MKWFVVTCERRTWTKYIVAAENREAALTAFDTWEYIGYVDGDNHSSFVSSKAKESREDALHDVAAFTEG